MRTRPLLVLLMVLLLAVPSAAQDEINTAIRPCSDAQIEDLAAPLSDLTADYTAFTRHMGRADREDLPDLIAEINDIQETWWDDIYPELPTCAMSIELTLRLGPLFDETLITLLLLQSEVPEQIVFATHHSNTVQQLSEEFTAYGQAILETFGN